MKNIVIGLLLTLVGIAALMLVPSPQAPAPMPWDIELMPDGNSKAFGIHLGTTTFRQAQKIFHVSGETAVFVQEGKQPTVEAFFNSIHLGGLSAKMVLNMPATKQQITLMLQRATEARLQPSGAHRYNLSQQDHTIMLDKPITLITYIPSIRLNKDRIEHRFGQADSIVLDPLNADTQVWQYTKFGLSIRINPNEKSILQYEARE